MTKEEIKKDLNGYIEVLKNAYDLDEMDIHVEEKEKHMEVGFAFVLEGHSFTAYSLHPVENNMISVYDKDWVVEYSGKQKKLGDVKTADIFDFAYEVIEKGLVQN